VQQLTLGQANQIIATAPASSRELGHKSMGIAARDESGHLKAFARDQANGGTGDEDEAICLAGIEAAGLIAG
jgi:uncharacterized protein GlcG (DUF336 family)